MTAKTGPTMHSFDPFAGLIAQVLAHKPEARELGVTKGAVIKWRRKAREAA